MNLDKLYTPFAYAEYLATYMNCPTTIRAHTSNHFGKGRTIPLAVAQGMVARRLQAIERERTRVERTANCSDVNDHLDFDARSNKYRPAKVRKSGGGFNQPAFIDKPVETPPPSDFGGKALVYAVAKAFQLTYADLMGPTRRCEYVAARAVIVKLLRERNPSVYSFQRIAGLIGRTDHSTAMNLLRLYPEREKRFPAMRDVYLMMGGTNA